MHFRLSDDRRDRPHRRRRLPLPLPDRRRQRPEPLLLPLPPNLLPPPAAEALGAGEVPLRSPMPGMIISYSVKVGDKVNTGDPVCILEAMKMQNSLTAPASGTVKAINFESGASVAKDAILLVISK